MPTFGNLTWEAGPAGWELYAIRSDAPYYDEIALMAWVYLVHATGQFRAVVFDPVTGEFGPSKDFQNVEDAQAWCRACVRMA